MFVRECEDSVPYVLNGKKVLYGSWITNQSLRENIMETTTWKAKGELNGCNLNSETQTRLEAKVGLRIAQGKATSGQRFTTIGTSAMAKTMPRQICHSREGCL